MEYMQRQSAEINLYAQKHCSEMHQTVKHTGFGCQPENRCPAQQPEHQKATFSLRVHVEGVNEKGIFTPLIALSPWHLQNWLLCFRMDGLVLIIAQAITVQRTAQVDHPGFCFAIQKQAFFLQLSAGSLIPRFVGPFQMYNHLQSGHPPVRITIW